MDALSKGDRRPSTISELLLYGETPKSGNIPGGGDIEANHEDLEDYLGKSGEDDEEGHEGNPAGEAG